MENNINESEFRNNVISELNKIRTDPKSYAEKLKEYMKCFKGKVLRLQGTSVMTNEGISAFKEACEFLEKVNPIKALRHNQALTDVASEYLKEIAQYEDLEEAREIDIQAIIDKYGYFSGEFRQSTDFGSSTPEMIAINMIVDDGDRDREMRKVLFTDRIKEIGVSMGNHPAYNYCTVLLLTSKFNTNEEEEPEVEPEAEIEEEIKETKKQDIKEISRGLIEKLSKSDNKAEEENIKETKNINNNKTSNNNHDKEIEDNNQNDEEDVDLPEDVVKMERSEKIITEKGVKKKLIKIIYFKEDGTKDIEVIKEIIK